jgi:hypothetical protein
MNYFRCRHCGRFISYKDFHEGKVVTNTPYGNSYDVEPPDEEYTHEECWWNQEQKWRDLTIRVSWIKPAKRFCVRRPALASYPMTGG